MYHHMEMCINSSAIVLSLQIPDVFMFLQLFYNQNNMFSKIISSLFFADMNVVILVILVIHNSLTIPVVKNVYEGIKIIIYRSVKTSLL